MVQATCGPALASSSWRPSCSSRGGSSVLAWRTPSPLPGALDGSSPSSSSRSLPPCSFCQPRSFLGWLLRRSDSRVGFVGAAFVAFGVVGSAGVYALDFASVELAHAGPPDDMRSLFIAMLDSPGMLVFRLLEMGLPIGLAVLAWALWSRPVARVGRHSCRCPPIKREPSRRRPGPRCDAAPGWSLCCDGVLGTPARDLDRQRWSGDGSEA